MGRGQSESSSDESLGTRMARRRMMDTDSDESSSGAPAAKAKATAKASAQEQAKAKPKAEAKRPASEDEDSEPAGAATRGRDSGARSSGPAANRPRSSSESSLEAPKAKAKVEEQPARKQSSSTGAQAGRARKQSSSSSSSPSPRARPSSSPNSKPGPAAPKAGRPAGGKTQESDSSSSSVERAPKSRAKAETVPPRRGRRDYASSSPSSDSDLPSAKPEKETFQPPRRTIAPADSEVSEEDLGPEPAKPVDSKRTGAAASTRTTTKASDPEPRPKVKTGEVGSNARTEGPKKTEEKSKVRTEGPKKTEEKSKARTEGPKTTGERATSQVSKARTKASKNIDDKPAGAQEPESEALAEVKPKEPRCFEAGSIVEATEDVTLSMKNDVEVPVKKGDRAKVVRTTATKLVWMEMLATQKKVLVAKDLTVFFQVVREEGGRDEPENDPPSEIDEKPSVQVPEDPPLPEPPLPPPADTVKADDLCIKCSAQLPSPSAKFCMECGAPQVPKDQETKAATSSAAAAATPAQEAKAKGKATAKATEKATANTTATATAKATANARARAPSDTDSEDQEPSHTSSLVRVDLAALRQHFQAMRGTLAHLSGKYVLIVLGRTGVGKSTCMQWFAGKPFKRVHRSNREVFEVDGPALQDFAIGHETKSKTKSIKHLVIRSDRMGEDVIYLDSAGFGDSSGVEVDIATSLSVKRVAEVAKALRMVVLVSCTSLFDSRGHGVRSLMELISSFAKDWKRHRESFTFLFTHTEMLRRRDANDHGTEAGRQADLEILCTWLEELHHETEVRRDVRPGESVATVKEVLQWIAKCLKKGNTDFASIFHPEDPNPKELRYSLENFEPAVEVSEGKWRCSALGLMPNEPCASVVQCGVSMEARGKLAMEVSKRSETVDRLLKSHAASDLREELKLLGDVCSQLADVPELESEKEKLVQKVEGRIRTLLEKAKKIIMPGTVRAPASSGDRLTIDGATLVFQQILAAGEVSSCLKESGLVEASDAEPAKETSKLLLDRIEEILNDLKASPIQIHAAENPDPAEKDARLCKPLPEGTFYLLECLHLWNEAAEAAKPETPNIAEIRNVALQGRSLITMYIEHLRKFLNSTTQCETGARLSAIARQSEFCTWLGQVHKHERIAKLEAIQDGTGRIVAGLQEQVDLVSKNVVAALADCIEQIGACPDDQLGSISEKPVVKEAFGKVRKTTIDLLAFKEHLGEESEILQPLREIFERGENSVEQEARNALQKLKEAADSALGATPELAALPPRACDAVCSIRLLTDSIGEPQGQHLRARDACEAALAQLCKTIDEHLLRCRMKLDMLWSQGQPASGHFAQESIEEQASLLKALVGAAWRERLQTGVQESDYNAEMVQGMTKRYGDYIAASSEKVLAMFDQFLKSPSNFSQSGEMTLAFAEREHLKAFSGALPNGDEATTSLAAALRERLATWREGQLQCSYEAGSASLDSVLRAGCSFAKELEDFFLVWEALGSLPGSRDLLTSTRKEAEDRLAWLKKNIDGLRKSDGHFEEKKQLLDALTLWSGDQKAQKDAPAVKLVNLCKELPTVEMLVDELRENITQESEKISTIIEEGANLEAAGAALEALRKAGCLDSESYLNGLVKVETEKWTQRLETKRLAFGEELEGQIEACDFESASEKLTAILKTESLKSKSEDLFKQIAARIQREYNDADTNISNGQKVAASMGLLKRASFSLDPFSSQLRDVDFQWYMKSLEKRMNNIFDQFIAEFQSALSASKLPEILKHQQKLVQYHAATKAWLNEAVCQKAAETLASSGKCLESVDVLVPRFIENLKVDPKDRTDTKELLEKLNELKELATSGESSSDSAEGHPAPQLARQFLVVRGGPHAPYRVEGIDVTSEESQHSRSKQPRLQVGSIIQQLRRSGTRMEFELLRGTGPDRGWISILHEKQELVWPASEVYEVCADQSVPTRSTPEKARGFGAVINAITGQEPLIPGTFVRLLKEEGGSVQFAKLSNHPGPSQGWADQPSGSSRNFRKVVPESGSPSGDMKPAVSPAAVANLYRTSTARLSSSVEAVRKECSYAASDPGTITRARSVYKYIIQECNNGFSQHIDIKFDIKKLLEEAEEKYTQRYAALEAQMTTMQALEQNWGRILNSWSSFQRTVDWFLSLSPYQKSCYNAEMGKLVGQATFMQKATLKALDDLEYRRCGLHCEVVLRMEHLLLQGGHSQASDKLAPAMQEMREKFTSHRDALCNNICESLKHGSANEFDNLFLRLYKFIKATKVANPELQAGLPQLHMQIAVHFEAKVQELPIQLERFELPKFKQQVDALRKFGQVLAGVMPLYMPLVQTRQDEGLRKLDRFVKDHFGARALDQYGRFYTILGLTANARTEDVRHAYNTLSLIHHPDKTRAQGLPADTCDEEQKLLNAAKDQLSQDHVRAAYQKALKEPFSQLIRDIPLKMRDGAEEKLKQSNYEAAKNLLSAVRDLPQVADLVEPPLDIRSADTAVRRVIKEHLEELSNSVMGLWRAKDLKKLSTIMDKLEKVDDAFSARSDVYSSEWNRKLRKEVTQTIESEAQNTIRYMDSSAKAGQESWQMMKIAEGLLYLGRIMDEIAAFKEEASKTIDNILDTVQEELGPNFVFKLGMLMEQGKVGSKDSDGEVSEEDKRVSSVVVATFRQFRDILTVIWNQQTSTTQRDIDSLLGEIKPYKVPATGPQKPLNPNAELLKEGVQKYNDVHDRMMMRWKANDLNPDQLVKETKDLCQRCLPCSVHGWSGQVRSLLPEILGHIGAYFTISKSGSSYHTLTKKTDGAKTGQIAIAGAEDVSTEDVLQKPHTIQILTLLRLFGFDGTSTSLERQLMQIRTGEGKSMILGMSSLLFALLGFRVRCVCYSEYLSNRDHRLFKDMFEAFGVERFVTYSKITKFSEDKVAEEGDIRQLTEDLLMGSLRSTGPMTIEDERQELLKREEILLLDEVDMFFGSDFYGRTHNQVATLESPEAIELLQTIWDNRALNRGQLLQHAKASPAYQNLLRAMSGFPYVIEREVRQMCSDVAKYDSPPYFVDEGKNRIGYKEMDGVSYEIVHGYRTAFAYLHEAGQKKFRDKDAALKHGLRFRVSCGQFCYNKIDPACIMGVSGTLAALGQDEWRIMSKYDIDCYTMMPSVYGQSNFKFLDADGINPITVTPSRAEQFVVITEQVKELCGRKRAVIVLFETLLILKQFEASEYYQQIQNKNILQEDSSDDRKDFVIKKAATASQATFTTAVFGRGTDFMCNDQRVLEAGGVHIIQAFVSADKSEEVQIQGRTARQGKRGTYCMVLCEEDLRENFGLQQSDLPGNSREKYGILDGQREQMRHTKYQTIDEELVDAMVRDKMTREFFHALIKGDNFNAKALFKDLFEKIAPQSGGQANHIVFDLDGSGSMGSHWASLLQAFSAFLSLRQGSEDRISVVVFDHEAHREMQLLEVATAQQSCQLKFPGGGTQFGNALQDADELFAAGLQQFGEMKPVLIFMSDGVSHDGVRTDWMRHLYQKNPGLQCHTVFFGTSQGAQNLRLMAEAVPGGQAHHSVDGIALEETFKEIATKAEYTG